MMKIELSELRTVEALSDTRETKALPGYVYVMPNGAWHAFRVSSAFEKSGDGSLAVLEPGVWISNLSYDEVVAVSKGVPGIALRSDSWLKATTDNILAAWGLTGANGRTIARLMASIVHRSCILVMETIEAWDASATMRRRASTLLATRPSLATAIAGILENDLLANRSTELVVDNMLGKTYQQGMFCYGRKAAPAGFLNLTFNLPRLSHVLALTCENVPNGGAWKVGSRSPDVSQTDFYKGASNLAEPLIFLASPHITTQPSETFDAFIGAKRSNQIYRSLFTREEYAVLRREGGDTVQSVFVGDGWAPSTIGRFLETFADVCGGRHVVAHSFTANLVAENIFAAAFRKPKRDTGSETPETVWLAARDRVALYPIIQDFTQFGASLVGAQHGSIQIQCPVDPEMISGIVEAAWRHGMTMPMDRIAEISALGVSIPYDRASYGGNPVDYTFSAIAQTGKKKSLFVLDEIMDADPADRSNRLRALLS